MSALPEFSYQVATDPISRSQFQVIALSQAFTQEEQEALSSLCHLLTLPLEKLLTALPDPTGLDGWFWP
jgi:hypothetical protein